MLSQRSWRRARPGELCSPTAPDQATAAIGGTKLGPTICPAILRAARERLFRLRLAPQPPLAAPLGTAAPRQGAADGPRRAALLHALRVARGGHGGHDFD